MHPLIIRPGTRDDIAPLDALLARSYPRLLAGDYPPSVLVTAIPRIARAQPRLVTCGTYYVAFRGTRLVGGGGWTRAVPGGAGRPQDKIGHIRHFATDFEETRSGVATALMDQVFATAISEGIRSLECLSTRTAVPFYERVGFEALGETQVSLADGIAFPAIQMRRQMTRLVPDAQ